jgi:hypothetical protein
MKLITGAPARDGDPEFGVSRGRLLPNHRILDENDAPEAVRQKLQDSLVLVHGGMAQNVGPILEMVTEKYLLRSEREWAGRRQAIGILEEILAGLRTGDVKSIGAATTRNFFGPIQTIIPWASTYYTELLIERVRQRFGADFWGFWMLGGMSGGGMGFMFAPHRKAEAQQFLGAADRTSASWQRPAVRDGAGRVRLPSTRAARRDAARGAALLPAATTRCVPQWLRTTRGSSRASAGGARPLRPRLPQRRRRLAAWSRRCSTACSARPAGRRRTSAQRRPARRGSVRPRAARAVRADLKNGRTGLAQNRLPASTVIETSAPATSPTPRAARPTRVGQARAGDPVARRGGGADARRRRGQPVDAGGGVVKALHPFCKLGGRHRSFVEVHLAKSRRVGDAHGAPDPPPDRDEPPHARRHRADARRPRAVQLPRPAAALARPGGGAAARADRARPALRLGGDAAEAARRAGARRSARACTPALINWATQAGEASDYTDNLPAQCLHPGRPLVRGAQPAPQRRARATAGRAAGAEVPHAAQHRHGRRRPDASLVGLHAASGKA